jgi:hypothetical protein
MQQTGKCYKVLHRALDVVGSSKHGNKPLDLIKARNLSTIWVTISFSRTLLHVASLYGCVSICLTASLHSPELCVSRLAARSLVVAAAANGLDAVVVFFELPLDGFRFFRAFFFSWNSSKLSDGRASIFSSKLKSLKDKVWTWTWTWAELQAYVCPLQLKFTSCLKT